MENPAHMVLADPSCPLYPLYACKIYYVGTKDPLSKLDQPSGLPPCPNNLSRLPTWLPLRPYRPPTRISGLALSLACCCTRVVQYGILSRRVYNKCHQRTRCCCLPPPSLSPSPGGERQCEGHTCTRPRTASEAHSSCQCSGLAVT